jgi:excinuclease ABC subunit A
MGAGMGQDVIRVRGAREHNLKNIDVTIPRDRLVVITGLSGSGKSSLAFDTLYAEGQRRYVESLSAYARQFLGQMEKPDVDSIDGLSPAISIDQKTTSKNPRSTVGTITEIFDYLRVLYANLGVPHCPNDGTEIKAQTAEGIVTAIAGFPEGAKLQVLAPVVKDRKGEYRKEFKDYKAQGFTRVRVNGVVGTVDDEWKLGRYEKHTIEIVLDRIVLKKDGKDVPKELRQRLTDTAGKTSGLSISEELRSRLIDAVEQALKLGDGEVRILEGEDKVHTYSEKFGCTKCGFSMPELAPRTFSFNAPHGACPSCLGLGFSLEVDADVVINNPEASLTDGCLHGTVKRASPWILYELEQVARSYRFSMDTPWKDLSDAAKDVVLHGTDRRVKVRYEMSNGRVWEGYENFEGIVPRLTRYYKDTESETKRESIQSIMASTACKACKGKRLKPEVLAVTVKDKSIADLCALPVGRLHAWTLQYQDSLNDREKKIAHEVV